MAYTIKELGEIIGRKPAMIYNYFNEDEEAKAFYYSHREKGKRGGFVYDDEVLERLKIKVGMSNGVVGSIIEKEEPNLTELTPPHSVRANEATENELNNLKIKYDELKEAYEKVESERQELLKQNGNLLLLLSQEKAEKQMLLPAPRKSIREKIRSLFKKEE